MSVYIFVSGLSLLQQGGKHQLSEQQRHISTVQDPGFLPPCSMIRIEHSIGIEYFTMILGSYSNSNPCQQQKRNRQVHMEAHSRAWDQMNPFTLRQFLPFSCHKKSHSNSFLSFSQVETDKDHTRSYLQYFFTDKHFVQCSSIIIR